MQRQGCCGKDAVARMPWQIFLGKYTPAILASTLLALDNNKMISELWPKPQFTDSWFILVGELKWGLTIVHQA